MTGFGRSRRESQSLIVTVEIQSVNSRQFDLNLRIPSYFKASEPQIRQQLASAALRGKMDVSIQYEERRAEPLRMLNAELAGHYLTEIMEVCRIRQVPCPDPFAIVASFPDVLQKKQDEPGSEHIALLFSALEEALSAFQDFRKAEGKTLENEFRAMHNQLVSHLEAIERQDSERIDEIRKRLNRNLSQFFDEAQIDRNRFEQELIYYLEKLDIHEEKTRLKSHCSYFIETLDEPLNGRKLNFIAQEMGREINTIGSKAQHSGIQRNVIMMKDCLEKIKEQLANIL